MFHFIVAILLLILACPGYQSRISREEEAFLCAYDGIPEFPIACVDVPDICLNTGSLPSDTTIVCATVSPAELDPVTNTYTIDRTLIDVRLDFHYTWDQRAIISPLIHTQLRNIEILSLIGLYQGGSLLPPELSLLPRLVALRLIHSGLSGTLPTALVARQRLTNLLLYNNSLSGTIPSEIGHLPPSGATFTWGIQLADNLFTGGPPDPVNMTGIHIYDLSGNRGFAGSELPRRFNWRNIEFVDLSNCDIIGTIPSDLILPVDDPNYNRPEPTLSFKANSLSGTIPLELYSHSLLVVDFSYNRLSGTLAPEIVLLSQTLSQFTLSYNQLSGTLPSEMTDSHFPYLFKLGLDNNHFTGSIPSFFVIEREPLAVIPWIAVYGDIIYLNFNDNQFTGPVPIISSSRLNKYAESGPRTGVFSAPTSLDLSNNRGLYLTNDSLGLGTNLTWLDLSGNNAPQSLIPSGAAALLTDLFGNPQRFDTLNNLDLSHCALTGSLPRFLRVQYLFLNNNLFTGVIDPSLIDPAYTAHLPIFIDLTLNRMNRFGAGRDTLFGGIASNENKNTEIVLSDFPQDFDECLLSDGTHACAQHCVDGWFPVPGYTCACDPGYRLNTDDRHSCEVICGDGILRYPDEACDFVFSKNGCSLNCTQESGFLCDATGCRPVCGDGIQVETEECDSPPDGSTGCSVDCRVLANYSCDRQNHCQACASATEWQAVPPPNESAASAGNNPALFPNFYTLGYNTEALLFSSCIVCGGGGIALQQRPVLSSQYCIGVPSQRSLSCQFACSNLVAFKDARSAIYTLHQQLDGGFFLRDILHLALNRSDLNITLEESSRAISGNSRKRQSGTTDNETLYEEESTLLLQLSQCDQQQLDTSMRILDALASDIVPNIPNRVLATDRALCQVSLSAKDRTGFFTSLNIGLIVGPVAGLFLLILIGLFCLFRVWQYRNAVIHYLPRDIAWSFKDRMTHPWRWSYNALDQSGHYSRLLQEDSDDYLRVETLLSIIHSKGFAIKIHSIEAVYNEQLIVSFINQWRITETRKREAPDNFFNRTYTNNSQKMAIMSHFEEEIVQRYNYNKNLDVPLIGALHGTDYPIATKIASTGFASLSTLDAGYFGKGIYFTTQLLYTLPYCASKRRPTIILSYLNMGNVFPVNEDHTGPSSLSGQALKSGYNSHFVITNKSGHVYKEGFDITSKCNEIVVNQESQILPAFLIELDYDSCMRVFPDWERKTDDVYSLKTGTFISVNHSGFNHRNEEEEGASLLANAAITTGDAYISFV